MKNLISYYLLLVIFLCNIEMSSAQKYFVRNGVGAFTPLSTEVAGIGGNGFSWASSLQLGAFIDSAETISFSTSFFMSAGEFKDVHFPGASLGYMAYGYTMKWGFHWKRFSKISLYSGLGVGFVKEDYTFSAQVNPGQRDFVDDGNLSYQIDVIGAQWNISRHFGLFSEIGFGYEGAFKFGWSLNW